MDGFSSRISRNREGFGISASGVRFLVSERCPGRRGNAEMGFFVVMVVDIVRESRRLLVWVNTLMK